MKQALALELVILEGEQCGARATLVAGKSIEIGGSLDSDIVLRDPLVESHRVKLNVGEGLAELDVLSGEVELMGRCLSAGQSAGLSQYQTVKIGGTTFAFGEVNSVHWPAPINAENDENNEYLRTLGLAEEEQKKLISPKQALRNRYLTPAIAVLLLLLPVLLSVNHFADGEEQVPVEKRVGEANESLHANGFTTVEIVMDDVNRELVVEGYLATYEEVRQLESVLGQANIVARLGLQVGERLAGRVQDIYRLNGIEAEVQIQGPGVVKVKTAEFETEKLTRVRKTALRDVALLKEIVSENDPSQSNGASDMESDGVAVDDPGKRITMIVRGNPAYIVTSDRSRYYIGAVLPSGHEVKAIHENRVLLSKGNVTTELNI